MKYAVEIGSGAMIYIYIYTKFHKDWFSLSEVYVGVHRHTDSKLIA
jgi:hypothetical protein